MNLARLAYMVCGRGSRPTVVQADEITGFDIALKDFNELNDRRSGSPYSRTPAPSPIACTARIRVRVVTR